MRIQGDNMGIRAIKEHKILAINEKCMFLLSI